jgi:hypothetical protein
MFPTWILRPLVCLVLLAQLPSSTAELIVSAAEGEIFSAVFHFLVVAGDLYFCYKIIRDGIE